MFKGHLADHVQLKKKIVKIENTRISNYNDVDRGSDYEPRRYSKTPHPGLL